MRGRPQRGTLYLRKAWRSVRLARTGHDLGALRFTQADDGHPARFLMAHARQAHRTDAPPAALLLACTR